MELRNVSSGRTSVLLQMFLLFLLPQDLRACSAACRETFLHDHCLDALYNTVQKFGGASPKKIWGKHAKRVVCMLTHPSGLFSGDYISAPGGASPSNFYMC